MFDVYIAILQVLLHNHPKEMRGLEIVEQSEGKVPRGTVYSYLYELEKVGEIASRPEEKTEEGKIRRRLYRLTDKGVKRVCGARSEKRFFGIPIPAK